MWRFKPFMPKEPVGLEGRTIDIGNLKFQVRNVIAEGGFSSVYLARDAASQSKQYALKHMICNDEESLDLVKKEISVMKKLKGHPNVVTLVTSSIFDMGRTKEALLVMEYCERSLVNVLESRGAGYYDEKLILVIFRDVCNAVFAMHCQSPPIAHRDLKAENVLLGSDGAWKLCDFGSISTNHKCFDRAEEMGIEEDNIRKHTTPAYRAPEMWDLYRREIISEKVDIWALGCLLYRICYFKSAFDGESKLQILNGNYRIPELPKYSSVVTDLIKDMLQSSPDARPDITQVWFRVNLQLPEDLQKETPDGPISALMPDGLNMTSVVNDDNTNGLSRGNLGSSKRGHTIPKRSPPPPPQDVLRNSPPLEMGSVHHSTSADSSKSGGNGDPLGAFWSTQHAQDALISSDKGPIFDEESVSHSTFVHIQQNPKKGSSPPQEQRKPIPRPSGYGGPQKKFDGPAGDFEIRFDQDGSSFGKAKVAPSNNLKTKASYSDNTVAFQNDAFDKFVAEFDTSKLNLGNNNGTSNRSQKEELEAEVERLKEQLLHSNAEKTEITSKFEKLSAICRAQRQEIQELKQALAKASIPTPPNKESSKTPTSSGSWQAPSQKREKIEGSVFELQQEMFTSSSSTQISDPKPWQAFTEEPKSQPPSRSNHPKSVRTSSNRHANRQTSPSATEDNWAFDQDNFSASPMNTQISKNPSSTPQISRNHGEASGSQSQRYGTQAKKPSQPAGWAGF